MWRTLEQVGSEWPGQNTKGRADGLGRVANDILAVRDIPNVKVVPEKPSAGNQAEFNFKDWSIRIHPDLINNPGALTPELVAQFNDLIRHEVEHTLQWWAMARLRAAQGLRPHEIRAEMHGLPMDVAESAVATVEREGMSPVEQAAARIWWDSIYSPTTMRDVHLLGREAVITKRDALRAEIEAAVANGEQVDPLKRAELAQLEMQVAGFETVYRSLPEEVAAYLRGGMAGQEAQLMQLELEVSLAETGLKVARDELTEIEHGYLGDIAAGRDPNPQEAADHAAQLEAVKKLEEQAVAARAKARAAAEAIAQGATDAPDAGAAAAAPSAAASAGAGPRGSGPVPAGGSARRQQPAKAGASPDPSLDPGVAHRLEAANQLVDAAERYDMKLDAAMLRNLAHGDPANFDAIAEQVREQLVEHAERHGSEKSAQTAGEFEAAGRLGSRTDRPPLETTGIPAQKSAVKLSHDAGTEGGRAKAADDGITLRNWDNPEAHIGDYGHGFDDVGDRGDHVFVVEYKGESSPLAEGQMTSEWIGRVLARLKHSNDPIADELLQAARQGRLRGIVYRTRIGPGGRLTTVKVGRVQPFGRRAVERAYHERLAQLQQNLGQWRGGRGRPSASGDDEE